MFTTRHYKVVANMLKNRRKMLGEYGFDILLKDFADMFEEDNKEFDRDKFFKFAYQEGSVG